MKYFKHIFVLVLATLSSVLSFNYTCAIQLDDDISIVTDILGQTKNVSLYDYPGYKTGILSDVFPGYGRLQLNVSTMNVFGQHFRFINLKVTDEENKTSKVAIRPSFAKAYSIDVSATDNDGVQHSITANTTNILSAGNVTIEYSMESVDIEFFAFKISSHGFVEKSRINYIDRIDIASQHLNIPTGICVE